MRRFPKQWVWFRANERCVFIEDERNTAADIDIFRLGLRRP